MSRFGWAAFGPRRSAATLGPNLDGCTALGRTGPFGGCEVVLRTGAVVGEGSGVTSGVGLHTDDGRIVICAIAGRGYVQMREVDNSRWWERCGLRNGQTWPVSVVSGGWSG